ncbi:ABC transporter ATP-binding protein [Azorhizobium caulinodans ORS 571]|uniref:ABC transporter ATP-binding protein n=1 Tax=Azorhizobium caulinodans (strain ATCC 43989 / DSM 5975 / JCM 20966 / LMG 6465 / NBRC 14845 / NCIMB 13405 / ORS 571) TaxID=438753 RepID=A8ICD7_AZOC5|nr:amino acid/amide ABC transporter ATP-binding protein 2 (HAAT family) [Azorhizobium sp. AG788]BAF89193.1 ABC transporter ATP-binding protein [Azorhizobium caulinodans ORS 571]
MAPALIALEGIEAGYGGAQVLFGIDLTVNAGEVVTLLGRNGMGKTTTIRTLFGLLPPTRGKRVIDGQEMTQAPPHKIAARGLGYVPEGRQIFPRLSVEENLVATARQRKGGAVRAGWTLDRVYGLFPRLKERRDNLGTQLSGGEQQMLAIGRALMTNPDLLVLDEATEGLAPVVRGEIWSAIEVLRADGLAILVVDKNIDALMRIADRHVVIEGGRVVWAGTNAELAANRASVTRHLEI